MNIVFAGTPEFACESLKALITAGYTPSLVLTQPDRPAGRGKKLSASPVKELAQKHDIPVWQPVTLRDAAIVADLAAHKPDLLIVAAYGLFLPQVVLDIPHLGCVNVHASLLPRWRGASPIQAAILAGDRETGISLMQMEAGLDTGPVLAAESLPIGSNETAARLHDRLAALGGELLVKTLPAICEGNCEPLPQDPDQVTSAGKIRSQDAQIDWLQPAEISARKVRAYNPAPGAWFSYGDERIKVWSAVALDSDKRLPGTVIAAGKDGIDVACSEGALRMTELQRPGRRRVSGAELAAQLPLSNNRLH
ncbi:MAG: methionyl-tRNA formyltransferase [Gammaproteobacteria bacterium]|nr:methionyl-tRNA formyltransferase [Gammaproteobacteria bacterium]MDH4315672.1 methionyl-tRNA formyltransferase [Gammaproteobacteria bacterium]MDH5214746.1 methionyl-tRNA formyltransferase [Gammaproteobacteria bacterium]MDH5499656.1 methionyl-tRNA formyltransferase [Gammaproteobacteria bacterium]